MRLELERACHGSPADRRDAFALEIELLAISKAPDGSLSGRANVAQSCALLAPLAAERGWHLEAPGDLDASVVVPVDVPALTFGPGGQLRIRSSATGRPAEAYEQCADLYDALQHIGASSPIEWIAIGSDPWHHSSQVALHPSVTAQCIDGAAPAEAERAHRMLSAAVRVFIGGGSPATFARRLAVAARWAGGIENAFEFAPFREGSTCGGTSVRCSHRRADSRRARVVGEWTPTVDALLECALDTRVLVIRTQDRWFPLSQTLTFRHWMERGFDGWFPDRSDFLEHVASLDLPVRPSGWIEIDVHDAQARPFCGVPLCLWSALLDDNVSLQQLTREPPADPRAAARTAFALAADVLLRKPSGWVSAEMVAAFVEFGRRFVFRDRTPADDALEFFAARRGFGLREYRDLTHAWSEAAGCAAVSSH